MGWERQRAQRASSQRGSLFNSLPVTIRQSRGFMTFPATPTRSYDGEEEKKYQRNREDMKGITYLRAMKMSLHIHTKKIWFPEEIRNIITLS